MQENPPLRSVLCFLINGRRSASDCTDKTTRRWKCVRAAISGVSIWWTSRMSWVDIASNCPSTELLLTEGQTGPWCPLGDRVSPAEVCSVELMRIKSLSFSHSLSLSPSLSLLWPSHSKGRSQKPQRQAVQKRKKIILDMRNQCMLAEIKKNKTL